MKGFLTGLFTILVFAPGAFGAEVGVSRALPTAAQSGSSATTNNSATRTNTRATTSQSTTDTGATVTARTATTPSRVVTTNGAQSLSPRDGAATATRATGVARATAVQNGDGRTSARDTLNDTVNTVGRASRLVGASINSNPAMRRAGITVRPSLADVGGRATLGDTGQYTSTNVGKDTKTERSVTSRAATTTQLASRESIAEAKDRLEQTAELNKSCQQQYNECMDQFCAVIDANQKRCSCSANLSKYTKVENAVKEANTQLNEVAQRIRYVGLSADEIRAIMTATEAEDALTGTRDTSESRNMLQQIEDMIKDPTSSSSYMSDTYSGFDMDLDFTADDLNDMFSLDFLNTNSGSFSNLRGTELHNAAKKRCNTILTQCKDVGATSQQITGNYDLAIDKDCIAYEQGLTKMNETLVSNVRSANRMLQKARLAVLQNKNQYDAKGCIAALESCMLDDMVCGDDYVKCLDPTKRYIDENGKVVLGQDITAIRDFMVNFNNAIDGEVLQGIYNGTVLTPASCAVAKEDKDGKTGNGACNIKYLLTKIGTGQKVTDEGLCRAVLDKCQQYTYDSNGNYKKYNDVVVNYIQRAMVNIHAAQERVISNYASSCMVDVATCYNQQVTQVNAWSTSASVNSIYNVMRGACRNVALTCSYAVFDKVYINPEDDFVTCKGYEKKEGDKLNKCTFVCDEKNESQCLEAISEMFYQTLLCPDNSTYQQEAFDTNKSEHCIGNGCKTSTKTDTDLSIAYVNEHCVCNSGYEIWGSQCLPSCGTNAIRGTYGTCACQDPTHVMDNAGNCAPKPE